MDIPTEKIRQYVTALQSVIDSQPGSPLGEILTPIADFLTTLAGSKQTRYYRLYNRGTGRYADGRYKESDIGRFYRDRQGINRAIAQWAAGNDPAAFRQAQNALRDLDIVPLLLLEGPASPVPPLPEKGRPITDPVFGFWTTYLHFPGGCFRGERFVAVDLNWAAWTEQDGWLYDVHRAHLFSPTNNSLHGTTNPGWVGYDYDPLFKRIPESVLTGGVVLGTYADVVAAVGDLAEVYVLGKYYLSENSRIR
jgi:hypothetical protein